MDKIFYPDSIVVIGVSERPDNLAANIIDNLLRFGYRGDIYAVGLRSGEAHGVPILTSVESLPDGVDLAVILTPAATVPGLLDACGRKGIRRAIIESGGFAEFSEAGRELEEQVEVFEDVAFRLAPLTHKDAEEMISEVRGSRLLHGLRGGSPADVEAVVEALLALSRLLVACPEVAEVDINPLLVFDQGVAAVDARVVVRGQKT